MDRAARVALVVLVAGILLTGAFLVALARPQRVAGEHHVTVPAEDPFVESFVWERAILRPGPLVGDPLPSLAIRYDGSATSGWPAQIEPDQTRGLTIRVLYVANGEEIAEEVQHVGSSGTFELRPIPIPFYGWGLWRNDLRVTAVVENDPLPGVTGAYRLDLGPVLVDHRASSAPQPIG